MMAKDIVEAVITIITAFTLSSGFWLWINGIRDRKSAQTELLLGLAHDRIMSLGKYYIEREYITADEYENLNLYLYKAYEKLGGNGSAKRIMNAVDHLPIKNQKENKNDSVEQSL